MMHLQEMSMKDILRCQGGSEPCALRGESLLHSQDKSKGIFTHQHPPAFQKLTMAGIPGPAGHTMLEVSPPLIGSVVWQSNLIGEN